VVNDTGAGDFEADLDHEVFEDLAVFAAEDGLAVGAIICTP